MKLKSTLLKITLSVVILFITASGALAQKTQSKSINNMGFTDKELFQYTSYTLQFTDTTSYQHGIQKRIWILHGDTVVYDMYPIPDVHIDTFPSAGMYPVTLIAIDSNINSDTVTKMINVSEFLYSGFNHLQYNTAPGYLVHFEDTTISSQPIGSRTWMFHDDTVSYNKDTLAHITHLYPQAGTYPVTLVVGDTLGTYDTTFQIIQAGKSFNAAFVYEQSDYPQFQEIILTDTSGVPPHFGFRRWLLHNDTVDIYQDTDTVLKRVYPQQGVFPVTLILADTLGNSDTAVKYISVQPAGRVGFSSNQLNSAPFFTVSFTDTSALSATFSRRTWQFPNDTISTMAPLDTTVNKTFSMPGNYLVTLIVEDTLGVTDEFTHSVTVQDAPLGHISGSVSAGMSTVDTGFAVLYQLMNGKLYFTDSSNIISGPGFSYFYFNKVGMNRSYIIKAELNPSDSLYSYYLPTYYGDSTKWTKADIIFADSLYLPAPVKLVRCYDEYDSGPCTISGYVKDQTDNSGVANVNILLKKTQQHPVRATTTDHNGYYEFTNLPLDNVLVEPEYPGYYSGYHYLQVNANQMNYTNVNFHLKDSTIVPDSSQMSGVSEFRLIADDISIYPNPARGAFYATISDELQPLFIELFTVDGQLIRKINLSKEQRKFTINTAGIAQSLIIVKVTVASGNYTEKLFLLK